MTEPGTAIPEEARLAALKIAALSKWINDGYPAALDAEARVWRRISKVTEENGEVTEAWLGVIGENSRKGQFGRAADVVKELLDVATTALGAVEHFEGFTGDALQELFDHVDFVYERAGLPALPHLGPPPNIDVERACEVMHDAYERAAVGAGWETQQASRKQWADVPEANKATMRAAVAALLAHLGPVVHADTDETERLRAELDRKGELLENRDDLLRDLRAEVAALQDRLAAVERQRDDYHESVLEFCGAQGGTFRDESGRALTTLCTLSEGHAGAHLFDRDVAAARPVPPVQEQTR